MKKLTQYRVAAVVFPLFKESASYTTRENLMYSLITENLKKTGIDYLDLTPYFKKYGSHIKDFRVSANDPVHFNKEANEISSRAILPWLIEIINKNQINKNSLK